MFRNKFSCFYPTLILLYIQVCTYVHIHKFQLSNLNKKLLNIYKIVSIPSTTTYDINFYRKMKV